jgi:thioredoxin 1
MLRSVAAPLEIKRLQDFDETVMGSEQPVVVDFYADWCGPCKAMAPMFERLADRYEGEVRFVKVDTERAPEIAQALGIRGLPTMALVAGGQIRDVIVGAKPEAYLEKRIRWLQDVAAGKGFIARLLGR